MKKNTVFLFILLALAVVAIVTCPDKEAHSEAIKDLASEIMNEKLYKNVETDEDAGVAMLGSMLGSGLAGLFIDQILTVDNYFVCSVGRITYKGEVKTVSVGMFNHIFTLDKDSLNK